MAVGRKTGGRSKGTPNRLTSTIKDNFVSVYDGLGGAEAMQVWASDNRTEFYRLYSRLIPSEHNLAGFDGGPIVSKSIVEFINPK